MKLFAAVISLVLLSSSAHAVNAPRRLAATVVSNSEIRLTWRDRSAGENGFSIHRSQDDGATFTEIARVPRDGTTFTDTGLTPGTKYTYQVYAFVNPTGSNVVSATTSGTTEPPPDPPPGDLAGPHNTGVPAGWVPTRTINGNHSINTAGAVLEDVEIVNGLLTIAADNVTVRRVRMRGGRIENRPDDNCRQGTRLEQVEILKGPGQVTRDTDQPAIGTGGYTAVKVKIDGRAQGYRVGGRSSGGCGVTTFIDSFARIVKPDVCDDWHGDGIQGYDGPPIIARNVTLELGSGSGCLRGGGTAPFFYPHSQGNHSVDIDGMTVKGGGYLFRLGMPGKVLNLRVNNQWGYGPIDVKCSGISEWSANIVTLDANYQVTSVVRSQLCNTEGGG